jgi:nucleolin
MAAALFSTSLSPRFIALSSAKPAAPAATAFLPFRLPLRTVSAPGRRVFERVAVAVSSEYETEGAEQEEEGVEEFSEDLKLFVGNLPFSVDSAQLAGLFEQAGSVEMVEVYTSYPVLVFVITSRQLSLLEIQIVLVFENDKFLPTVQSVLWSLDEYLLQLGWFELS